MIKKYHRMKNQICNTFATQCQNANAGNAARSNLIMNCTIYMYSTLIYIYIYIKFVATQHAVQSDFSSCVHYVHNRCTKACFAHKYADNSKKFTCWTEQHWI